MLCVCMSVCLFACVCVSVDMHNPTYSCPFAYTYFLRVTNAEQFCCLWNCEKKEATVNKDEFLDEEKEEDEEEG